MQLSLGWVCVLHQKLHITVNCSFKCTYKGQIAGEYKVPYHGCGRIWARVQLREIMAFGESWLTSVHPKGPLFRTFAADNAIAVECETWVEPSLAWAISYNRWNVCSWNHLFSPGCSFIFIKPNKSSMSQMEHHSWRRTNLWTNETYIWAYYGFEKLAAFGPFCWAKKTLITEGAQEVFSRVGIPFIM